MRAYQFINENNPIKLRGFGETSSKSQAFVNNINSQYPQSFMSNKYRMMTFGQGNDMQIVQFELVPLEKNWVEIKWLQATPMQGGAGTRALDILKQRAEEAGINYKLYVWEKGVVSKTNLIKFYKRNGFKRVGKSNVMKWESNPRSI